MKVTDAQNKELMAVRKIEIEDGVIVIRGKIFGAMPMVAKLTPEEARAGLKLLGFRTILKMIPFLLSRSRKSE
jgi:ATP-dependent phosphoenolpyruvate carboxykinase